MTTNSDFDNFESAHEESPTPKQARPPTPPLLSVTMSKPLVLVTSATSKNGTEAAKQLLASNTYRVRLGCRDPTKLNTALIEQGAEGVVLDSSPGAAEAAFKGVDYAYIILPIIRVDSQTPTLQNYIRLAKDYGLKHFVYLSDINVDCDDHFARVHDHYKHEQLLLSSAIPCTILHPAWFYENTVTYHTDTIKHRGLFYTSAANGIWTCVAVRDIAAAVVAVLSNPVPHDGKVYPLQTEAITDGMLAEKLSQATGKMVKHVNMKPAEYVAYLLSLFHGMPWSEVFANALMRLEDARRESRFSVVSPDLENLLGRKGMSVDVFLAERAAIFSTTA